MNIYEFSGNAPANYFDTDGRAADLLLDAGSACVSAYDLYKEPSWKNAGFLAWDIAAVAIPFVPATYTAKLAKKVGLLALPRRSPFHHIFPQRPDLAAEFQRRGIDVDKFTMQIPKSLHDQIHSGGPRGGDWNKAWDDFFKANPGATAEDCYKKAGNLIYEFQLPGGPVVPYPN